MRPGLAVHVAPEDPGAQEVSSGVSSKRISMTLDIAELICGQLVHLTSMAGGMVAEPPEVHKELGAICTLGAAGNGKQIAGNQMRYGVGELVFRACLKP
jgi:hypothetical protein